MSEPPAYPPDPHITRDLSPVIERTKTDSKILLPIVPELTDATGRLRVGVAATMVDIICGETAIRKVLPGWVATLGLSLQVGDLPSDGTLAVGTHLLRQGRTTLVQEASLSHVESGKPVGLATITFSILPGRRETQTRVHWTDEFEPRTVFASEGSGFEQPLHDALGFRFSPSDPSVVHADVTSYVINTLGAMQGGVVAMLLDAAGDHHAAHELGGPTRIRSLEIHYMRLARVGPIRATARTIGTIGSALLVRVELTDEGQDDQLATVASLVVEREDR